MGNIKNILIGNHKGKIEYGWPTIRLKDTFKLIKEMGSKILHWTQLTHLRKTSVILSTPRPNILQTNIQKIHQSLLFTNWRTIELFEKIIKIYIKTASTCFGLITIIRERIIWGLLKL
jgi:hypothetical protein